MTNATSPKQDETLHRGFAKPQAAATKSCMFCGSHDMHSVVDLGMSPLCESYVSADRLNDMEPFYPLHVFVCNECYLVQLDQYVEREHIFTEYAYFSSYSDSWVKHMEKYTESIIDRLGLNQESLVIEVGSNDGYLLQHFVSKSIPVLGIEPAANVAQDAIERGIPTRVEFFGVETAKGLSHEKKQADLIAGANVMAQVPDINDFVGGLKIALKPGGVITIEFPHLMRLIAGNQFDTIYHEHFTYFSLVSVERIFEEHQLTIFDVEELKSHGGSLRIYAKHSEDKGRQETDRLRELRARELAAGVNSLAYYEDFAERVKETKRKFLDFLIAAKREGKSIAGYGAPGKGNTLLNYCGVRTDFIDFTVDKNPYKQGMFLPGTHIPIYHPDRIREAKPDYIIILPWNLREEIAEQISYAREWGGKFVVPIPEALVF